MQLSHSQLGLLTLAMASLASLAVANVRMCDTSSITSHRVKDCKCWPRTKGSPCSSKCTGLCYTVDRTTNSCTGGCKDLSEGPCKGCGIWYHTLCDCLQDINNPQKCRTSFPVVENGPAPWVHLITDPKRKKKNPKEHDLITTTEIISGILDMTDHPSQFYEDAWIFAQDQWDPSKQALAMNPWHVRTEEQVHIHMCNLKQDLKDKLKDETPKAKTHLIKLEKEPSLWCYAAKKGDKIETFVAVLAEFIEQETKKKGGVCRESVGAGMMQDENGRTWACATTEFHGPLPFFCDS